MNMRFSQRRVWATEADVKPNKARIASAPNSTSPIPASHAVCPTIRFLLGLNFPERILLKATHLATQHGSTGAAELIAYKGIGQETYCRALAQYFKIRFVEKAEIKALVPIDQPAPDLTQRDLGRYWATLSDGSYCVLAAPCLDHPSPFKQGLKALAKHERFVLTSPDILRELLIERMSDEISDKAINHLGFHDPASSSRFGADAWQGAFVALFFVALMVSSIWPVGYVDIAAHLLLTSAFFCCALLRFLALLKYRFPDVAPIEPRPDRHKPIYSVLVALHHEVEVIPDLIAALKKLQWPRTKLEIKLVCEADDAGTLDAIAKEKLDSRFEVIRVPASEPRTKPKALCYALQLTTGQYVTLYDAEDRPHPEQLLEAYQAFENGPEKLACVQAPLDIANNRRNFWSAMFSLEYCALFRGLIPWLAGRHAPIPLGGTSNHFKRSALVDVGEWDPFNVTEDADLGFRLWRRGFETGMITRPTLEDAPTHFRVWLFQRSRWIKGWMQTWIVHSKDPAALLREMPITSFLITQTLSLGTVASALIHPIALFKIGQYLVAVTSDPSPMAQLLLAVDCAVLCFSYFGFTALCWRANHDKRNRSHGGRLLLVPVYWLFISAAAWHALIQLFRDPFKWEKTPHCAHEKPQKGI